MAVVIPVPPTRSWRYTRPHPSSVERRRGGKSGTNCSPRAHNNCWKGRRSSGGSSCERRARTACSVTNQSKMDKTTQESCRLLFLSTCVCCVCGMMCIVRPGMSVKTWPTAIVGRRRASRKGKPLLRQRRLLESRIHWRGAASTKSNAVQRRFSRPCLARA